MRKLKLIKVTVPEIVAYFGDNGLAPTEPEYQCTCGMGVAREYKNCPYCIVAQLSRQKSKIFIMN